MKIFAVLYQTEELEKLSKYRIFIQAKVLLLQTLMFSLLFSQFMVLIYPPLLLLLKKREYRENLTTYSFSLERRKTGVFLELEVFAVDFCEPRRCIPLLRLRERGSI
uniref:Uncharacterized protein n=1 Tax=Glossina austeni TaxID=7395 RepID=A0A1A9VQ51_GLOAU